MPPRLSPGAPELVWPFPALIPPVPRGLGFAHLRCWSLDAGHPCEGDATLGKGKAALSWREVSRE